MRGPDRDRHCEYVSTPVVPEHPRMGFKAIMAAVALGTFLGGGAVALLVALLS